MSGDVDELSRKGDDVMRLEETLAALREAAEQAYAAMDAACRWAAGETAGVKTTQDADRHMAGYDALLDATVSLGQTLGILSGAALATTPAIRLTIDAPECVEAIRRVKEEADEAAALDEARAAVVDAQKALGSFLWLGNNLHNSGTETFREMYQAALEDATRGYEALAAIDALREAER